MYPITPMEERGLNDRSHLRLAPDPDAQPTPTPRGPTVSDELTWDELAWDQFELYDGPSRSPWPTGRGLVPSGRWRFAIVALLGVAAMVVIMMHTGGGRSRASATDPGRSTHAQVSAPSLRTVARSAAAAPIMRILHTLQATTHALVDDSAALAARGRGRARRERAGRDRVEVSRARVRARHVSSASPGSIASASSGPAPSVATSPTALTASSLAAASTSSSTGASLAGSSSSGAKSSAQSGAGSRCFPGSPGC